MMSWIKWKDRLERQLLREKNLNMEKCRHLQPFSQPSSRGPFEVLVINTDATLAVRCRQTHLSLRQHLAWVSLYLYATGSREARKKNLNLTFGVRHFEIVLGIASDANEQGPGERAGRIAPEGLRRLRL